MAVAQLVESRIVIPVVVGSSPIGHPKKCNDRDFFLSSEYTVGRQALWLVHKDPFDRRLIAQSISEDMPLVTLDPVLSQYPGGVQQV